MLLLITAAPVLQDLGEEQLENGLVLSAQLQVLLRKSDGSK